jgi:aspartate/methionine/tyrosine aminotransferase
LTSSKRSSIPPFIVMDVMRSAAERAAAGDDVIHLEVGQPGTAAPRAARDAALKALESDPIGYTDVFGNIELRERIADYYRHTAAVDIDPTRIIITAGASGAFLLAFLACFDAGQRVAVTTPGYPAYRNILHALNVEPVTVRIDSNKRYEITPEKLAEIEDLNGLVVASPANPTGSMISDETMRRLVAYCVDRGVRFISDEIYHGITYERSATTALKFSDDVIAINSFSKYFSMTGWRLGWMVAPQNLMRSIETVAQNLFISPNSLSQIAALASFDDLSELDDHVTTYAKNRAYLLHELPRLGFRDIAPPDGAFYLYADIQGFSNDSVEFCKKVLRETGVAMTPGVDFDPEEGKRAVRISFAGPYGDMREAVQRLRSFLVRDV